jgi:hypothetical protein
MKTPKARFSFIFVIAILVAVRCQPPDKPDYDWGYGQLIYADRCGQEPLYLLDLAGIQAYQSGQNYQNTLTIDGAKYMHVIRLDSSQANFLSKRKVLDKIGIDFRPLTHQPLPNCVGVPTASVQSVQVLSVHNTDYQ